MTGKSYKGCIDTECKRCSYAPEHEGGEGGGTWRRQVANCGGTSCDLYNVRPLPKGERHDKTYSRRIAVVDHCKTCIYDKEDKEAKGTWRQQVAACKSTECGLYTVRPMPYVAQEE